MNGKEFWALLESAGVKQDKKGAKRAYDMYTYLATAQAADSEVMHDIAKICISSLEKRARMRAVVQPAKRGITWREKSNNIVPIAGRTSGMYVQQEMKLCALCVQTQGVLHVMRSKSKGCRLLI